ncbi:hypothetical protein B0H16DRAFT_1749776 [Mycena metata]|uniref:Uncharacterized protein n=1 Tax=Mycena metata TaxID=1033252 RepID=A0AAD7DST3_9AGAR|nr:hypothetical protein B0H16DRAFT_1749776 [Mycena metata]
MFFASISLALAASIFSFASALVVPDGFTSVTAANLSSLAATSKFVIASQLFGTQLNPPHPLTNRRVHSPSPASILTAIQWILNNVVGSPTEYTIQSISSQTFLSFPGDSASTISYNGQTIIDSTCYPTFTIQQLTPGVNGYRITENTFGGILTAWAQYTEGTSIGMATFQVSADLGAAQVWVIAAATA